MKMIMKLLRNQKKRIMLYESSSKDKDTDDESESEEEVYITSVKSKRRTTSNKASKPK